MPRGPCWTGWCVTEVRLIVFVTGNESRGDDGVGPLLLARLARDLPPGTEVVREFQLQVEHALALDGADLVLFIDAAVGLQTSFVFAEAPVEGPPAAFSHALSPAAVLDVFRRIEGREPPPAFVLGLRAWRFGLGEGVSAEAARDLEDAFVFARTLLAGPSAQAWRAAAQARTRLPASSGKNSAV